MSTPNGQPTRSTRATASGGRLPSLRPIRDLSLGGGTTSVSSPGASNSTPSTTPQASTRPKFAPNLASAGRRQTPVVTPDSATKSSDGGSGRGRGGRQNNERGGRGRGRGRGGRFEHEIIQSRGIFSEGLAEADTPKTRPTESDGGGGGYFARRREREDESKERQPKTGPGAKSEAIETDEEALKQLLKDDFIVHRPNSDRVKPVTLPLRAEKPATGQQKLEDGLMDGLMDVDFKPDFDVLVSNDQKPPILRLEELGIARETLPPAFQEIFKAAADDKIGEGSLFFIQLPNIMTDLLANKTTDQSNSTPPEVSVVKAEVMDIDYNNIQIDQIAMPIKSEPSAETEPAVQPAPVEQKRNPNQHTLAKLPQGQIGKLQFMKSGKIRLKLNGATPDKPLVFDAAPGTETQFLQQVVSIRTPNRMDGEIMEEGGEQGQLCIVGDVRHRLLFTPKIDNLLVSLKKMTR